MRRDGMPDSVNATVGRNSRARMHGNALAGCLGTSPIPINQGPSRCFPKFSIKLRLATGARRAPTIERKSGSLRRGEVSGKDQRSAEAIEYRRLYSTARWKRLRAQVLAERPLCEWCLEREVVEPATDVHHAEAHRGDLAKFWSGPLIATCRSCHASRGQREDLGQTVVTFAADGWPV